jgi:twitching motility protein PilT
MRVIPTAIPDLAALNLPGSLGDVADVKSGIVLVTGPVGSGKSSTLAAIIDLINRRHCYHIITIEDPIEFLHNHIKSTIHQRELHNDAPNAILALRSALRQSPNVIFVAEMRDRETIELILDSAETGHLILSSMNTLDAAKTVDRMVGVFAPGEQPAIRKRVAKSFRYIISQRLIPRANEKGVVPAVEIVKANLQTRECIVNGEHEGQTLANCARNGAADGMQDFDTEIAKLIHARVLDPETALAYATNPSQLIKELQT